MKNKIMKTNYFTFSCTRAISNSWIRIFWYIFKKQEIKEMNERKQYSIT